MKLKTWAVVISLVGGVAVLFWLRRSERRNDLAHANSACIANLKQIQGAVEQYALENKLEATDRVFIADISGSTNKMIRPLINQDLTCPRRGAYSITTVGEVPRCSHPEHAL